MSSVRQLLAIMVCKITTGRTTYFDVRADKVVPTDNTSACKTAKTLNDSACMTAGIPKSVCKKTDLVNLYFSDEDRQSEKVNIMLMHKEETVYPNNGRRRKNPLRHWIIKKTDEAIKTGSRKEICNMCQYTTSCKKMNVHFRQHFTKHFCSCGYRSASYNSYLLSLEERSLFHTKHLRGGQKYPRFFYHIGWRTAPAFGECLPTLVSEGKIDNGIYTPYTDSLQKTS